MSWTRPSASRCTARCNSSSWTVHHSPWCCNECRGGDGQGVSGFQVGPLPDYTHYWTITEGVTFAAHELIAGRAVSPAFATSLFGLVLVTFLIGRAMPIDPVIAIVGDHAPPDVIAHVRLELGLDRPLYVQFGSTCAI